MRSKKRVTRDELHRAIQRIGHRRPKRIGKDRCRMNISTVAREAGVSAASIHNTYPDIAETIRAKAGKSSPSTLDTERLERKRLVALLRDARGSGKPGGNAVAALLVWPRRGAEVAV
jgi:hypothetical protein